MTESALTVYFVRSSELWFGKGQQRYRARCVTNTKILSSILELIITKIGILLRYPPNIVLSVIAWKLATQVIDELTPDIDNCLLARQCAGASNFIQACAFKIPSLYLVRPLNYMYDCSDLFNSPCISMCFTLWDQVLNPIITESVNKSQLVYNLLNFMGLLMKREAIHCVSKSSYVKEKLLLTIWHSSMVLMEKRGFMQYKKKQNNHKSWHFICCKPARKLQHF